MERWQNIKSHFSKWLDGFATVSLSRVLLLSLVITTILSLFSVFRPRETLFLEISGNSPYYLVYQRHLRKASKNFIATAPFLKQTDSGLLKGVYIKIHKSPGFKISIPANTKEWMGKVFIEESSWLGKKSSVFPAKALIKKAAGVNISEEASSESILLQTSSSEALLEFSFGDKIKKWQNKSYNDKSLFAFIFIFAILLALQGFVKIFKYSPFKTYFFAVLAIFTSVTICSLYFPFNHGPDEEMHISSMLWHAEHTRPPSLHLKDQAYRNHIWFNSYVIGSSADLSYLLTAKLATLASDLSAQLTPYHSVLRVSQIVWILIFAGLIARVAGAGHGSAFLIFLGTIPQLLYLCTYINGDILSLCMCVLGLALCSQINKAQRLAKASLLFYCGMFFLFNVKTNYITALPFTLIFVYKFYNKRGLKNLFAMLAIASPLIPLVLYRKLFNYFDQLAAGKTYREVILELAEHSQHPVIQTVYTKLKHAGDPSYYNFNVLTDGSWYYASFYSYFGSFGYMTYLIESAFLTRIVLGFLLTVFKYIHKSWLRAGLVAAAFLLSIAASLHYSITYDYQPQGRYVYTSLAVLIFFAAKTIIRKSIWINLSILTSVICLALFALNS